MLMLFEAPTQETQSSPNDPCLEVAGVAGGRASEPEGAGTNGRSAVP